MTARIVCLSGGIASGKTTVSNLMARLGCAIIDTDEIAHALTAPGGAAMSAIVNEFGAHMQSDKGAMDRAAMRKLVFEDASARKRLEAILHPLIHEACQARISAAKADPSQKAPIVCVVPLLHPGSVWLGLCERIVVVDCTEAQQLARLMTRSSLDEAQAKAILAAQISRHSRLALATDVINNQGDGSNLTNDVTALVNRLTTH